MASCGNELGLQGLRLLTPREREEMMAQRDQWARKMAERDKAQRTGEQPAIEVQARRIEDKNGSNGAGGK